MESTKQRHTSSPASPSLLGIFLAVFFSVLSLLLPAITSARGITKLEQQINITNGEFLTTSATDTPADNSLGLISFDGDEYSGDTVYFEAVAKCVTCSGTGNHQVSVSLYDTSGAAVSTLTTSSSTYERLRSPTSLSLSAGEYTVRFHRDDDAGTAYLLASRLIILQSASSLTDTLTQIELGHYEDDVTNTSAVALSAPKYYLYDHDQYSGTVNAYFEATLRTNANNATTAYYFDSYDTVSENWTNSPGNMTDGSTATFASTALDGDVQRLSGNSYPGSRSEVITKVEVRVHSYQSTDTSGALTLRPVFGGSQDGDNHPVTPPVDTGAWSTYQDITDDSNAPSTWTWTHLQNLDFDIVWNQNSGANTGYVSQVDIRVTYEDPAVLAYAELYNRTHSQVVGNSTISTSSNSFSLVRSSALTTNWDIENDDIYEVRVYTTGAGNPLDLSNAKIIIDQTDATDIKKVETILHQVTTARSHNNTIYATQNFLNQLNPANFSTGNRTRAFFEVNFQTTAGGTAYARLYNRSDSDDIDTPVDSLQTTNSTSLTILRSGNLADNTDWPSSAKNLDTTINATSGHTTSLTNAWVIVQTLLLDPSLTFTIEGVAADETNSGITSSVATTVTTIPFGFLSPGTVKYATHKLTIETNEAATQFIVYLSLGSQLQGNYPGNNIDPFTGSGATWADPKTWTEPTGSAANIDTGWIGANTSDTAVTGWSSGSGKFGPLDTSPIEVARSADGTTKTVYVSYGFEVNMLQPSDSYSGQVIYNILPTY